MVEQHTMISIASLPRHHAILILDENRKKVAESLWGELEELSFAHSFFDVTVLDIEDARSISIWANTPFSSKKIALISFHTITVPAQNALLKVVEEPREDVQFIFLTSNKEMLLPTLLSRMLELTEKRTHREKDSLSSSFLHTKKEERMKLAQITQMISLLDEEGRKDREPVRTFILSLAEELRGSDSSNETVLLLIELASYAALPSSSTKAILEYIALTIPEKK